MRIQTISSPEDQSVTFVELFFDLVFVFSVTQIVVTAIVIVAGASPKLPLLIALIGIVSIAVFEQGVSE